MTIAVKRIYDERADSDGFRVLVDRLWPRGVRKAEAAIDWWAKDLAPSSTLRQWFAHDPDRFDEFSRRYRAELGKADTAVKRLFESAGDKPITFLYAAKDPHINHAVVLKAWLETEHSS